MAAGPQRQQLTTLGEAAVSKKAGFIFGHIFGVFILVTTPHLDNATDDHRYSRLLPDFRSVGVVIILTVCFLEKNAL